MIEWQSPGASVGPTGPCPNCGSAAPRPRVLRASLPSGDWVRLHACPDCGAHAFEGPMAGAYDDMPAGGTDALAFYLQQGANIGGMALRLMGLGRPAGTQYLEVGCGFGLSLDFARRILGWRVLGLDPSPFAVAGREQLGLPIESRFLRADDLDRESADVIHASEFIEHMADPVAMLTTLRQALRPGGTLLLTTPAAEMIRPDTGEGLLVPLLSAGWHLVIHTAGSLEWALRRAGFSHVEVVRHGAQLVAVAGDAAPAGATAVGRDPYVEWLRQLSYAAPAGSDLGLGAMARLYRELTIAQAPEAEAVWQSLDGACSLRFGQGLKAAVAAPEDQPGLAALTAREPLGLAGIALARGWQCRQAGQPAEAWFRGAIAAAGRLRGALRRVGADDGDAEDVAHAAEAELIRLAAAAADPGVAARIIALRAAGGAGHADAITGDCFVTMVNSGALEEAQALRQAAHELISDAALTRAEASIMYCAATLELQLPGGDREAASAWLGRLRSRILASPAVAPDLYWPAVDAQMLCARQLGRADQVPGLSAAADAAARGAGLPPRAAGSTGS